MINGKEELQKELKGATIIAAKVKLYGETFTLKAGHSKEELQKFWEWMDRRYDDGYGGQNLFGTVWLEDSWLERAEYDGSEWWAARKRPPLP